MGGTGNGRHPKDGDADHGWSCKGFINSKRHAHQQGNCSCLQLTGPSEYPKGWQPGIHVCVQIPLFQLPPSFEVLNMNLPAGAYTFHFAVDENADGIVDETWKDSVEVRVE